VIETLTIKKEVELKKELSSNYSAVESDIKEWEHSGVNKAPDNGLIKCYTSEESLTSNGLH